MKKISTAFDYSRNIPTPLATAIYDTNTKNLEIMPIYLKGLGTTVRQAKSAVEKIVETAKSETTILNDVISHLYEINNLPRGMKIYESRRPCSASTNDNYKSLKKKLINNLLMMSSDLKPWMLIKARSAIIYHKLYKRGLMHGPYKVHPLYDTNTLTGRSRTREFNIQGTSSKDPIRHVDESRSHLICFDWVSADMRMAGYLSNDEFINNSFDKSDPYTEMEKLIGDKEVTREDCKIEMLKSIYKVDVNSPLLGITPELREWISDKIHEHGNNVEHTTILNMPIPKVKLSSTVNGIIQGSVAEALQAALIRIAEVDSDCILTEIHDSIILACNQGEVSKIIDLVVPIMNKPLKNIFFPVKVSIGRKWKQWKEYKVYR